MPTTRRSHPATLLALLLLLLGATPAAGAVATALLHEDGPMPGGPGGHLISALSNTAVNHAAGYSVTVNTTDGATTLSHIWGNATGGAGAVLRTEGTFGPLVQTAFESFFGMSDAGNVSYSPTGTGGPVGAFDSVWLDDTPLAVEGDPIPSLPGQFWRFASRPGVTANGTPYWVGGTTSTQGGATQRWGLFYGPGATVVLLGGQAVPNLPFALALLSTIGFDYRYSALGSRYIAPVVMASGSTLHNDAIVWTGSGLLVDGTLVREQTAVPAAAGGTGGERWSAFDFMGTTEDGHWFFTGDTDGPTATDEIIVKDGAIVHREGSVLDGRILTGDIEGAYMNEEGDIAFIWDVAGVPAALEALYVNDQLELVEGDLVDLDGDGVVEPNSRLVDFTGISALTMSDRDASGYVRVYFTADVDTLGTPSASDDVEGFFCLTVFVDQPTAVLASLVSAMASTDRVEITWALEAAREATVYRTADQSAWIALGTHAADGSGMLRFVDSDVVSGRRYGYRLGVRLPDGEATAGETYVTVPGGPRLALLGAHPNPSVGTGVNVSFSLPDGNPATLDLLDVGGRRVASRQVGNLGPGTHVVGFAREASQLPAGMYVIRLVQGGRVLTSKLAITR